MCNIELEIKIPYILIYRRGIRFQSFIVGRYFLEVLLYTIFLCMS